jgi:hypothetical protein
VLKKLGSSATTFSEPRQCASTGNDATARGKNEG